MGWDGRKEGGSGRDEMRVLYPVVVDAVRDGVSCWKERGKGRELE